MSLLISRRLAPLLLTQTLGAFNDNLFKNAMVVMILFTAGHVGAPAQVAVAGGVFILPYLLFSATAGQLADAFEKRRTILFTKGLEVALMVAASAGFLLDSMPLLYAVLFGLGVQATLFSPLKYAILPDHLAPGELVAGNGLVEAGTFLGILVGTIAGSALYPVQHGPAIVSGLGVLMALAGIAAAFRILPAPSAQPDLRVGRNPLRETVALLRRARANRALWLAMLALSWFWAIGAATLTELPTLVRDDLRAAPAVFTLMLAVFSVGVGTGSVLCARLLRGEVSTRLVPAAALGLTVFLADFGLTVRRSPALSDVAAMLHSFAGWHMLIDLLLLAVCGGVYSVPLYAVIQERSAPGEQARMIAATNILNAVAIVGAAVLTALLAVVAVAPATVLVLAAAANLLVAAWTLRMLPASTLRSLLRWYFVRFHGVRLAGLENLPPPGQRCVLLVNHQSLLDGVFVAAFLPGEPTFVVNERIAGQWWVRPLLLAVRSILVDPYNAFSTKAMVLAVQAGERLVIFPEGRLSTTGALMKVYDGAGLVALMAGATVVPVRIDGLQDTRLTRLAGRMPRRWFPRLALTVLPPVDLAGGDSGLGRERRNAVGATLQSVMERAAFATAPTGRTLFAALLDATHRHGARTPILEDTKREPLTYRRLLLGAAVLGRRLATEAPLGGRLGVMLPNANGAVVVFMALQAFGRVPAMLNFSAGAEAMLAACSAAGVTTVLSSHAFVEGAKLEEQVARMAAHVRFVWLEEVRTGLGLRAKLRGMWDARRPRALPGASLPPDAAAIVLFTAGSEGVPKGVVLSHRNIVANIAQCAAVIDFTRADRMFNALPMFHSFGLTGGTLLPLLSGVRTFLYPSPLHYRIVPELIYDTDSTIAFGTDTFLTGWAKFAHPYDFYSMRYIFAGAEKLREETRRLYADRFGVRVMQGYGVTETAPVLAVNTPIHSRVGSVGRLLPGMEHRLDPVEGIAEGGRLVIRGPNVMLGYLRPAEPGVIDPPPDGWHDTGDVCTVDEDGFVFITARAKRFAKIGGEMVSMPAAEALAAAVWPDAEHAVVAIPDPRKGEALLLLTTQPDAEAALLLAEARARGMAEIAVARQLRVVAELPRLATGKVDYPTATRLAGG